VARNPPERRVPDPEAGGYRDFVTRVLGCACPQAVLADLRVRDEPSEVAGLPLALRLNVGGRMLLYVASGTETEHITAALNEVFVEGRRARDAEGFHRFRFALASAEGERARSVLAAAFAALPDCDERLHLHVVAEGDLPPRVEDRSIIVVPRARAVRPRR
jgi:hypothetical protein